MIKLKNYKIETSVLSMMTKLQAETGNPKDIIDKDTDVLITCPFHKDGNENKPSCSINANEYSDKEVGIFQCWACKEKGFITKIISNVLQIKDSDAEEWILQNFPYTESSDIIIDDKIQIENKKETTISLDSYEPLNEYSYKYLIEKRNLRKDVVDYFHLMYNRKNDSIVFPVYNMKNDLAMITERSINNKSFYIQKDSNKPVYLLNEACKYNTVYICESQINALTLWGWGYPAAALFGTGSFYQYDILNKSGIRNFVLCFDGDQAGYEGSKRFIKNIKHAMIYKVRIPAGKDVNDLTKEEFIKLQMT